MRKLISKDTLKDIFSTILEMFICLVSFVVIYLVTYFLLGGKFGECSGEILLGSAYLSLVVWWILFLFLFPSFLIKKYYS